LNIQAEKIALELENKDCSCSNGWIDRLKNQHSIVHAQVSGEALSADTETASAWVRSVWEECKKGYTEEEVYKADKTGIF
jgi:hypothetical protein